jgi:phosphoenolpyruvate phosphomutase
MIKTKNKLTRLIGCHDGMSAKLVEEFGFEGIWSSGFGISTSYAVPDASILGKEAFLERAIEMRKATKLPILQDMDTGYGGAGQLKYHVRDFEDAGINGICIEDKIFPKTNSFVQGGQDLMDIEDFCQKIISAKKAQRTKGFKVVARIEAFISGFGLEDAIYRANSYAEVGADAIVIHSKEKDGTDIKSFLDIWDKQCPIIIIPTTYAGVFTEKEMVDLGVDCVIYANQLIRAMVKHGREILKEINKNGINRSMDIASMDTMFEIQNMPAFRKSLG